jgi:PAS domain S-box-containing protein
VLARLSVAAAGALAIFALDVLSPLQGAVAVLYTTVILAVAREQSTSKLAAAGCVCGALALIGYWIVHGHDPVGSPAMRLSVSLVAIVITTLLCVRQIRVLLDRSRADERYRTIFNAAGFPIWESDWSSVHASLEDGALPEQEVVRQAAEFSFVRDANDEAARLFGYVDRSQLIGDNITKRFTAGAQAAQARIFEGLLEGRRPIEEEMQFRTTAGNLVDVVLRVTLPPDDAEWRHVLITALDVTQRNRAQERLTDAQAALTHMSRVTMLGQLAASIAHEVNQPLSAIITYARSGRRWLIKEPPAADEVADCLEHIVSNGSRAADVIARIRDLARKSESERHPLLMPLLIAETIGMLDRELTQGSIMLRSLVPEELPEIDGDRIQLQQVFMNLLLNAQEAMADTPPDQRLLVIEARAEEGRIIIDIRDHGRGLDGVDPETLFHPFFTTKTDGLGIGLSICRSIAEQHGGSLTAASHEGGGAQLRLILPTNEGMKRMAA